MLIIVAFYITDFFLIARYDRERKAEGSGRSWDYTLFLLTAAGLMVLQPLVLPALSLVIKAQWGVLIQVAALLLACGGLGVHWWSRASLRQFYAERVELQPEHQVIDKGPYAYVRHPVFTSFFMLVTGCFLLNPSLPTLLMALYTFWDFSRAARQEEQLLSQNLPGYGEYMARTRAFFPGINRLRGGK